MTCWSDMAYDALERITSFLPLTDHHRFSAVCKNWRLVAKQKRHSPAPQLPWLVLGDEPGTGKRKFYNLSEDMHYAMDIPELYGRYICGSSHGWLIAIDIKLTGILINPFTREFYELPLFPQDNLGLPAHRNVPVDYGDFEKLQVIIVQKTILSHDPKERPDFTLMILVGFKRVPAFWKPGDSSWTVISAPRIKDVIYFYGHFYFVTNHNALLFLDFQPDPKVHDITSLHIRLRDPTSERYLVDYFGNLLLVERVVDWICLEKGHSKTLRKWHSKTRYFNILRLDFEKKKVYRSKTIGEAAIFLGTNDSIVINPNDLVPGCKYKCKTKSIYFTEVAKSLFVGKFDMGIFNTSEKTFSTFYPPEIHHSRVGAPIWFTPNPW
ncbi:F-box/kelch-repeat protein At1g57790-like [Carex rostrata]